MENFKYKVYVEGKNISVEDAGDAIVIADCARDLHFYRTGRFGYVISKRMFIALACVCLALDILIVYSLVKLLG